MDDDDYEAWLETIEDLDYDDRDDGFDDDWVHDSDMGDK